MGSGWPNTDKPNPDETPKKTVVARCDGPDAGYIATAGCVLSSALTLLQDRSTLPSGFVFILSVSVWILQEIPKFALT